VATQVLILFDDHDVMMNAFTTKERKKERNLAKFLHQDTTMAPIRLCCRQISMDLHYKSTNIWMEYGLSHKMVTRYGQTNRV